MTRAEKWAKVAELQAKLKELDLEWEKLNQELDQVLMTEVSDPKQGKRRPGVVC
jgi:hypothetical protein